MKIDKFEKIESLVNDVREIKKIDKLINNREHGKVVNVLFKQHYGETNSYERVSVPLRYTPRFLALLHDIKCELDQELDDI